MPPLRKSILAAAVLLCGWGAIVLLTGGIDARAGGFVVRARDPLRPLVVGAALLGIWAALDRRAVLSAARDPDRLLTRAAPWMAGVAAVAVTILAIRFGAFVAGGSDAYGYVSQAYGWTDGRLPAPEATPLALPFPSSDWLQTPLGYWPGRTPHTIVPSYPPGLPLLMALGIVIADPIGPYLVVPLSAGLFVWATYLLARGLAGPVAGAAAAVLAATSPAVLFLALSPMSDVPSAAIWTGVLAATIAGTRRSTLGAALLAALGILVRPNLAPLALLPLAWIATTAAGHERWTRIAFFTACVAPSALAIGALNAAWYGSPLLSGYGNPAALYSVQNVWPNLRHYTMWIVMSQSPFIAIAALPVIALARPSSSRAPVALAAATLTTTVLCYLAYERYELWWYVRFLLPAFGALFALAAAALVMIARMRAPWGRPLASIVFAVLVWRAVAFAGAQQMYGPFKASEHKYADAGVFVANRLPAEAVLLAMQHSGSLRYYGGRHTLRYDLLDRDAASRIGPELERLGRHPYLAIEDAEQADVRRVFNLRDDAALPWRIVARMNHGGGFMIYDLASHPGTEAPIAIEQSTAIRPRHIR
jgi:hypothetical protein